MEKLFSPGTIRTDMVPRVLHEGEDWWAWEHGKLPVAEARLSDDELSALVHRGIVTPPCWSGDYVGNVPGWARRALVDAGYEPHTWEETPAWMRKLEGGYEYVPIGDILHRTLDLVNHGWTTDHGAVASDGRDIDEKHTDAVAWDLIGAISRATWDTQQDVHWDYPGDKSTWGVDALRVVARAIDPFYMSNTIPITHPHSTLWRWTDKLGRTQEDAVKLLTRALLTFRPGVPAS